MEDQYWGQCFQLVHRNLELGVNSKAANDNIQFFKIVLFWSCPYHISVFVFPVLIILS